MIEVKNLTKIFADGTQALDDVSIKFKENKISGLIGFNGSGKTTTFNIIANFIKKTKGQVFFNGKKFNKQIMQKTSYLAAGAEPKNPTKVISQLLSIASLYNIKKNIALKKINGIAEKIDFKSQLHSQIRALSKGNQQKVKVISALLNPQLKYLLLDEPFDGLDPIMVEKLKRIFLKLKNVTIIITSHRMEVVQSMCYEFFVLKDGKLVSQNITEDNTVELVVNKEVPLTKIKSLSFVKEIRKSKEFNIIIIKDLKSFKKVNKILIASPKYIYSSLRDKNIAAEVFERYGV